MRITSDGLARALAAQGKADEAIAEYRKFLNPGKGSKFIGFYEPRYHVAVARLFDKQGKKAEARPEYGRCLALWKKADASAPELAEARARTK